MVKTPILYYDTRSVAISYQVSDAYGHTAVDLTSTDLSVMQMVVGGSGVEQVIACMAPDPISGIGACHGTLPSSWFSTNSDIELTVHAETTARGKFYVSSPMAAVTLTQAPVEVVVTDPGLTFFMAPSPQVWGNSFTVPAFANTFGLSLNKWQVKIYYNSDDLMLRDIVSSANFTSIHITNSSSVGNQEMIQVTLQYAPGRLVGTKLFLFDLMFDVIAPSVSASVIHDNVLSMDVDYMTSSSLEDIALAGPASFVDMYGLHLSGGGATGASMLVVPTSFVGVWAFTANSDIVNTAALSGTSVLTPITVEGVYNHSAMSHPNAIITDRVNCALASDYHTGLMDIRQGATVDSNCVVELKPTHYGGTLRSVVDIVYTPDADDTPMTEYVGLPSVETTVAFKVWYPTALNVRIKDKVLNNIH